MAPGKPWERLEYAMMKNHFKFVANSSVQKLIKRKFYEGPIALKDFESSHIIKRVFFLSFLALLTPFWLFFNLFFPESDSPTGKMIQGFLDMPFMRFIVQMVFYSLLLLFSVMSSTYWERLPEETLDYAAFDYSCYLEVIRYDAWPCLFGLWTEDYALYFYFYPEEYLDYIIGTVSFHSCAAFSPKFLHLRCFSLQPRGNNTLSMRYFFLLHVIHFLFRKIVLYPPPLSGHLSFTFIVNVNHYLYHYLNHYGTYIIIEAVDSLI